MSREFVRIGLRSTLAVLSTVLIVLVLAVAIVPSAAVASDGHTMNIRGYVYDNAGRKIANANVTLTLFNGTTAGTSKTVKSESTPDKGYFSVNFATGEWATGETVRVVAQYNSLQATNDTGSTPLVVLNGNNFFQWKNVTFPYEIPQFGSTVGLLVAAGLVGVVATVALVWRRKAK